MGLLGGLATNGGLSGGSAGGSALISDSTLGADAANIDFTSIAQTYKHLRLVIHARSAVAAQKDNLVVRFNNDSTATHYVSAAIGMYGSIAAEGGYNDKLIIAYVPGASAAAGLSAAVDTLIPDYTGTTLWQEVTGNSSGVADSAMVVVGGGSFKQLAAISRITIFAVGGNLLAGSRASLYGLS
jgi:hypothetical protein